MFFRSRSCDNGIAGMTRHHLVINLLSWGLMKHLLFSFQASRRCCKQLKTSQLINSLSRDTFASYASYILPTCQQNVLFKGQLISERNFGVFKSPDKQIKFERLGQKSFKKLVRLLGDSKIPKICSKINRPLLFVMK